MPAYTHAGGIVIKRQDGKIRFLIVSAKQEPKHWVFPKGHIIPWESAEETAKREVHEEAGVEGDVLEPIGASEYHVGNEIVHVQFFLMRYVGEGASAEGRRKRWCSYSEALGFLSFEDARDLLRRVYAAEARRLRTDYVP
jgi:ADP-ribose pyrophosphatase YjhB (NUDIX family)